MTYCALSYYSKDIMPDTIYSSFRERIRGSLSSFLCQSMSTVRSLAFVIDVVIAPVPYVVDVTSAGLLVEINVGRATSGFGPSFHFQQFLDFQQGSMYQVAKIKELYIAMVQLLRSTSQIGLIVTTTMYSIF